MLKKNLFRLVLSCALTLSYVWTACQGSEVRREAKEIPTSRAAQAETKQASINP